MGPQTSAMLLSNQCVVTCKCTFKWASASGSNRTVHLFSTIPKSKIKIYIVGNQTGKECFQLPNQTATVIQSPFDSEHHYMRRTHQCVAHPKQLLCYCLAPARASERHSVFVCPAVTQCVCLDVCMCVCVCECEAHTHPRGLLNQD